MGGTDYLTDILFIASVCFRPVEFIPIIQTNDESINYLRSRLYFSRSELNTQSRKLEKTKQSVIIWLFAVKRYCSKEL